MSISELSKSNEGRYFEFTFSDAEVTVGKLLTLNYKTGEFIYEMSSTSEPTRYHNLHGKYSALLADLSNARLLDRD